VSGAFVVLRSAISYCIDQVGVDQAGVGQ